MAKSKSGKQKQNKTPLKRKPLKPISDKRKKQQAAYSVLREQYLKAHKVCEICGKPNPSDVHHIYAGADRAKYQNDTETWMALCRNCHQNKVHLDPINARKNGWLK